MLNQSAADHVTESLATLGYALFAYQQHGPLSDAIHPIRPVAWDAPVLPPDLDSPEYSDDPVPSDFLTPTPMEYDPEPVAFTPEPYQPVEPDPAPLDGPIAAPPVVVSAPEPAMPSPNTMPVTERPHHIPAHPAPAPQSMATSPQPAAGSWSPQADPTDGDSGEPRGRQKSSVAMLQELSFLDD